MILRLLCEHEALRPRGRLRTVLDYGCGSGVLALAALLLEPASLRAVGTDVSEAAAAPHATDRRARCQRSLQPETSSAPQRDRASLHPVSCGNRPATRLTPASPPSTDAFMPPGLSDRLDVALPWELSRKLRAQLSVANMLPGPLISVASDLAASTAPGGTLIVTGFQRRDLAAVSDALAPCFAVPAEPTLEREGWISLVCSRTDAPVQWRRD